MNPSTAAQPTREPGSSSRGIVPRRTVLLVDDESSVREVTVLFLNRLGFEVLEAGSADEALLMARNHPHGIDLLMTDVLLAGGDGRALADKFAKLRPQAGILFTSGSEENQPPEHDRRRFLSKPYLMEDLRRVTHDLLG